MDGEWDVVFELKYSRKKKDFKDALDEGEKQVLTCRYSTKLRSTCFPLPSMTRDARYEK